MAALADNVLFNPTLGGTTDWVVASAVGGYMTPAQAGMVNGRTYKYRAESSDLLQWEVGEGVYTSGSTTLSRVTVLFNSSGGTSKINFTTVPIVGVVQLKEDTLSVEEANSFTATQQSQARTNLGMSTEVGKIEWWPTSILQPGRLKANGASFLRVTYPILLAYLVRSGSATFTNGSANVGMAAHALSFGDPIKLFTAGSLPTNFTAGTHGLTTVGTNYFVKTIVDANTVTLSATVGGTAIIAGSAGSGAHTWVNAPHGDGDGSTTATVPDMRGNFARGWNDDASIDANRAIGNLQLDAFQGHRHGIQANVGSGGSYGWGGNAGTSPSGGDPNNQVLDPTTDGTNGTPRTAAETRPRNVSLMATIRYSA